MPITVTWGDNARTFVLYDIDGEYTVDEFFAAMDEAIALMETVDYQVGAVLDYCDCPRVPVRSVTSLPKVAAKASHPNYSQKAVIVGAEGLLVRNVINIFSNVFTRLHFANTLEEAAQVHAEATEATL